MQQWHRSWSKPNVALVQQTSPDLYAPGLGEQAKQMSNIDRDNPEHRCTMCHAIVVNMEPVVTLGFAMVSLFQLQNPIKIPIANF